MVWWLSEGGRATLKSLYSRYFSCVYTSKDPEGLQNVNSDRCVEVVNKLHEPSLSQPEIKEAAGLVHPRSWGTCRKANHVTSDNLTTLSGLDYFCAASDI